MSDTGTCDAGTTWSAPAPRGCSAQVSRPPTHQGVRREAQVRHVLPSPPRPRGRPLPPSSGSGRHSLRPPGRRGRHGTMSPSVTRTRPAPAPAPTSATGRRANGRSTRIPRPTPRRSASRSTSAPAPAPRSPTSRTPSCRRCRARTAYVTISVGGNDAGFAERAVDVRAAELAQQLQRRGRLGADDHQHQDPGPLASLYSSIRAKAPNARVIVVGYPRIFNGEDCNALTVVLADGGVPPQRDRGPAQLARRRRRRPTRASPSPTRPRGSSGTPSATTPSGSTACRARSPRATTRTSPATGTATPS